MSYYEEIGLLKSSRKDDYAYRVYNEEAILRLQQIIILRKLQIPMKQIKDILNNKNAVTIIEVFKQNISELDEEITALSAVKAILTRFVNELQEKADVQLKLDLLNDKTMIAFIDSISLTKHKIKGKASMDELNKASETLNEMATKNIRIVYMPPMTMAFVDGGLGDRDAINNPEIFKRYLDYVVKPYKKGTITMRDVMKTFIDDVNLFELKPDTRIFRFQNYEIVNIEGYNFDANGIWASIPEDLDVPFPLKKTHFPGGWYAVCVGDFNIDYWTKNNDDYVWNADDDAGPIMEELINPYNRHGSCLPNSYSEETGIFVTNILYPIKKIKKYSDKEKENINKLLSELIPHGKSTNIDLTSLIKHDKDQDLKYTDGVMIIKSEKSDHPWENVIGMATPQKFNCPLKIELRVKSDNGDISIHYANGYIISGNNGGCIFDVYNKKFHDYTYRDIKYDEFADFANIEWVLGKKFMVIKINGEIRYFSNDCEYIKAFNENPEYTLSSAVSVNTANGTTITVESLRVTEL